jgi:hypothetical protein
MKSAPEIGDELIDRDSDRDSVKNHGVVHPPCRNPRVFRQGFNSGEIRIYERKKWGPCL